MKNHLRLVSFLLVASTFVTPVFASGVDSAEIIRLANQPYIGPGMTRETVREMLGMPSAQLSTDAWVYFDFRPVNAVAAKTHKLVTDQGDTLVVTFANDRVNLVRLCDSRPVRAFIAQQLKAKSAAMAIAMAQPVSPQK